MFPSFRPAVVIDDGAKDFLGRHVYIDTACFEELPQGLFNDGDGRFAFVLSDELFNVPPQTRCEVQVQWLFACVFGHKVAQLMRKLKVVKKKSTVNNKKVVATCARLAHLVCTLSAQL